MTPSQEGSQLATSPLLKRPIRRGSPEQLGRPTRELIREALAANDAEVAGEYLDYYAEECRRIFTLYSVWLRDLLTYGRERAAGAFSAAVSKLEESLGAAPPMLEADPANFTHALQEARDAIEAGSRADLDATLENLRDAHLAVHDPQAEWCWGLLTVLSEILGEQAMDDVFRETQGAWVRERYAALGEMSAEDLVQLTVEGMRGHHGGRQRDGKVDIEEDETKWVLSFDPCGSGGRMRRGDPGRGQTPLDEPPFRFTNTEQAHDWSWSRKGVCLYCAHCAVVNEIIPIELFGAPMRVTDYPTNRSEPCRWTIYKDKRATPEDAYLRVGKTRPPDLVEDARPD